MTRWEQIQVLWLNQGQRRRFLVFQTMKHMYPKDFTSVNLPSISIILTFDFHFLYEFVCVIHVPCCGIDTNILQAQTLLFIHRAINPQTGTVSADTCDNDTKLSHHVCFEQKK